MQVQLFSNTSGGRSASLPADSRVLRYALLLVVCVVSRLLTAIYYVEDTDSLRFALSVFDYDVARLQPHFPGYPVFSFTAQMLYALTGSLAVSFALIGGCAVFVIAVVLVRLGEAMGLCGAPFDEPLHRVREPQMLCGWVLTALVVCNPLVWLMSNRFMPDLSGLACLLAALYFLTAPDSGKRRLGFVLCGLLGGIRLSYEPMLVVPLAVAVVAALRERTVVRDAVALLAGTLVWLVPLIAVTGWEELIAAATMQTEGHFTEFGGTILTEGTVAQRALHTVETVVADGLGMYLPGRHWLTIAPAVGLVAALAVGLPSAVRKADRRRAVVLVAGWAVYLLWIVLFQNVLHKNRHILPLLPPFFVAAAVGYGILLRRTAVTAVFAALTLVGYAVVGGILAVQHTQPTAIAQVREYLERYEGDSLTVVAVPLVNYYLSGQKLRAVYIAVDDSTAAARVRARAHSRVVSIGKYERLVGRPARRTNTFYHNPFVNRMWPEVTVYEYE